MAFAYNEYCPSMSQCHRYTAAPANGFEPLAVSSTVSLMVSGIPRAAADPEPKLRVMSLRPMPLWLRTLAPWEPSAGNGPPVSSGILPVFEPLAAHGLADV